MLCAWLGTDTRYSEKVRPEECLVKENLCKCRDELCNRFLETICASTWKENWMWYIVSKVPKTWFNGLSRDGLSLFKQLNRKDKKHWLASLKTLIDNYTLFGQLNWKDLIALKKICLYFDKPSQTICHHSSFHFIQMHLCGHLDL